MFSGPSIPDSSSYASIPLRSEPKRFHLLLHGQELSAGHDGRLPTYGHPTQSQ